MKMVLQKFIAQSGYCSRRQAEELIRLKKVLVNGKIAELGIKVDEVDNISIQGKRISTVKEKIYIILNKPKGYVCTNRKFKDEKNVFEILNTSPLPAQAGQPAPRTGDGEFLRLFVVGRLDKDSRGLVLLTNDGDLTQKFTHPSFEHEKEYEVNVKCQIFNVKLILEKIKKGVDIGEGDGIVKAKKVEYLGDYKFKLILTEGKKRQIRRMFKAVECEVIDLVRVRIGKIVLGGLKEGKWRKLTKEEIVKANKF
jgi:23S rRNA pseudouridine2605 synthase